MLKFQLRSPKNLKGQISYLVAILALLPLGTASYANTSDTKAASSAHPAVKSRVSHTVAKSKGGHKISKARGKPHKVVAVDPKLKAAVADYKAGKYADALAKLETVKPSEQTHYYAGLCYQGQNQMQLAKDEFSWVYTNSGDPRLRYNSEVALSYLAEYDKSRHYKGQGNNFAKPVQRNVGGRK